MRTTTYCYPWDLARLGVARALGEIAGHGIQAIDLAANYHPIDALSPRGGVNLFSDARGAVYFPARAGRYGRIKPLIHSPEIAGAWSLAAEEAARIGLGLNSWTITLFQPWIRDAHPDCARVLPWGDSSGSGVCAANPDVRTYIVELCADLADQFGIDLFRLEGVLPHTFDLDWLRPRALVRISALARTLSNLCFCGSCKARGKAAGIDVSALQARVVRTIEAEIVGEPNSDERAAALALDADLMAFAESHARASIELVGEVAARVGHAARVSANAITPYRSLLGDARDDALLTGFITAGTQVDLNVLNPAGNRLVAALNAAVESPRPLSALYVTIRNPTVTSAAQVAESGVDKMLQNLQATADVGVRELSLYNYGLLPDADVRVFMEAVGQLRLD
ncbi:hypothetical protein SAMN05518801_101424 [Novosphingobium sp. CF614]|uniref:hypothetical protein n=1 Tax=Novosphingobium sp. CF614 TaxID=1884364 RepID=UPI0008E1D2A5|nr:hypothetical protein [Novosphingobium sp. CF614]SFF77493.1 hypothetical protein SAMN05518801_101424 [Novosphingobium sp. CF614]